MLKFLGSQVTHGVYRLALVFALPLLLVACGGGGGGGAGESPTPTPASITAQPVDRSAVAGSAVSFNLVARNAVSYQWQQTETAADNAPWRDILGATEASYTTPGG